MPEPGITNVQLQRLTLDLHRLYFVVESACTQEQLNSMTNQASGIKQYVVKDLPLLYTF